MTQDRFLKLLDNPDLLATISYEELKTLALTYPYANNLRYLLAIKSGQEDLPDFSRNLAAAAAYSLDRTCLFNLMAPHKLMAKPVVEEQEQILELKPIAAVKRELDARAPVERETTETGPTIGKRMTAPDDHSSSIDSERKIPDLDLSQSDSPLDLQPTEVDEIPEDAGPAPDMKKSPVEPAPSFSVWISQFNPPILKNENATRPAINLPRLEPKKEAEEFDLIQEEDEEADITGLSPQAFAERSVQESKSILSETLAKLYAEQGYRDKAIDMYERLCLAFPDKCTTFAAEIEKLKR